MKTMLFNPGPTNVSPRVKQALQSSDICHREPEFTTVLRRLNSNIVKALGGEDSHSAVLFVSSGTGCNEAVCASIHGKVLVLNNGKYAGRIVEILERFGVPHTDLLLPPQEGVDLNVVEKALQEDNTITHMYVVHHETTTGVLAPLRDIGALAERYHKLLCVDAVSSLGGHELHLQHDNIAFCTVSANKCLESYPGVSFVLARTEELQRLEGRSRSFYFDLYSQWAKSLSGQTPFTPAVQLVLAMDLAIQELLEEGPAERIKRYQRLSAYMREGLKKLGFTLRLLPEPLQSNILTVLDIPLSMDYWKVHDKLKERGITIYSDNKVIGQGKFRVATMGHLNEDDIDWFLLNVKEVLEEEGVF